MSTASSSTEAKWVGQSVPRKEDYRLLTGGACYTDDLVRPGMLWAAVVRSPFANARIEAIDLQPALEQPGVVAAFSGRELAEDWKATSSKAS